VSDDNRTAAWRALANAARAFAEIKAPTPTESAMLSDAAKAWGRANLEDPGARARPGVSGGEVLVPFGRSKGQPLSSCSERDLEWLESAVQRSIDDPAKSKYLSSNTALLNEIQTELHRR